MTPASVFSAPCEGETFFCHSNMCINQTLVCNGIQNCVFPWDENHCKGTLTQWLPYSYMLALAEHKVIILYVIFLTREKAGQYSGHTGWH